MSITLNEINNAVISDEQSFIRKCEEAFYKNIKALAERIVKDKEIKIVAIAGPSASGKTTTSKILKSILSDKGVNCETVSLDDFYLEIEKMPVMADGKRNFETVDALDTKKITACFSEIIENGSTLLPYFDFKTKKKYHDLRKIDMPDGIVIVEGLHALNPIISDSVDKSRILKIYISVNEQVLDNDNSVLLTSKKIRLLRRIIRDVKFRGTDVSSTLALWSNVVAEEERSLYKYKDCADITLATFLPYELCVYKDLLDEVDLSADKNAENFGYYMQTLNALEKFEEIDDVTVPYNSLIREFIGDGKYN